MDKVKHVTRNGEIIYQDGSEIGIEKIVTRVIETGDDVTLKNLKNTLARLSESLSKVLEGKQS